MKLYISGYKRGKIRKRNAICFYVFLGGKGGFRGDQLNVGTRGETEGRACRVLLRGCEHLQTGGVSPDIQGVL